MRPVVATWVGALLAASVAAAPPRPAMSCSCLVGPARKLDDLSPAELRQLRDEWYRDSTAWFVGDVERADTVRWPVAGPLRDADSLSGSGSAIAYRFHVEWAWTGVDTRRVTVIGRVPPDCPQPEFRVGHSYWVSARRGGGLLWAESCHREVEASARVRRAALRVLGPPPYQWP